MKFNLYILLLISLLKFVANPLIGQTSKGCISVKARTNSSDTIWKTYCAKTLDSIQGYKFSTEPERSSYGGWKSKKYPASGFFRIQNVDSRWWIIDPEGFPFIHKGVAVFRMGASEKQEIALEKKYRTPENWVKKESELLKNNGFNGVGAWSDFDRIREQSDPLVYTVIVNPMSRFIP
ncbi:MAG: hypothetical protein HC905_26510, partial [Bacteroidales bacterium]|nr:hypothetical protein [Bacteroidales bacterium]